MLTEIINRRKRAVDVVEQDGFVHGTLAPGESLTVDTNDPATTFARWERIVLNDSADGAELFKRSGWKEEGSFTEYLNLHGTPVEIRDGLVLMRGVPVRVLSDVPKKIVIRRVTVREPSKEFDGYIALRTELSDVIERGG